MRPAIAQNSLSLPVHPFEHISLAAHYTFTERRQPWHDRDAILGGLMWAVSVERVRQAARTGPGLIWR